MLRFIGLTAAILTGLGASSAAAQQSPTPAEGPDLSTFHTIPKQRMLNFPDISDLFPERALSRGIDGEAKIHCYLEPDGQLHECSVVEELPTGYAFGLATIEGAKRLRIRPLVREGVPVEHEKIEWRMRWSVPHSR